MGMTMSQKILAAHAGLKSVKAGQLIEAQLDLVLANDITAPVAINEFKKAGAKCVACRDKIALVMDHFTPNKDIKAAMQCKAVRDFSDEQQIVNFFDVGNMGIEHALLPEQGLVGAGDLVIGADSHTCTYGALGAFSTGVGSTDMAAGMMTQKAWFKVPSAISFVLKNKPAKYITGKDVILHIIGMIGVDGALYRSMEFSGDGVQYLSMDDRFTICNMAIEAGAKNGIFPVDDVTRAYMKGRVKHTPTEYTADEDAPYEKVIEIDLAALEPTVSFPHLPENTKTRKDWDDRKIDQVVIGSCTNGHITDLRIAAEVLKGRKVAKHLRCIIIPATQTIYLQAVHEGLVDIFIKAGAIVSTPTCGPCLGGHMGILAEGERCVSTTNRNFVGRMGHITSEIYLASPYVAAASAVAGKIATPDIFLPIKTTTTTACFNDMAATGKIVTPDTCLPTKTTTTTACFNDMRKSNEKSKKAIIIEKYTSGTTNPYEIAEIVNCSCNYVTQTLQKAGIKHGRPQKNYKHRSLSEKTDEIISALKEGRVITEIAKTMHVSRQWVHKIKNDYLERE